MVSSEMLPLNLPSEEETEIDLSVLIPAEIAVGGYATYMIWDSETLLSAVQPISFSRVLGDPESDKYPIEPDFPDPDLGGNFYWKNILGAALNKSETWIRWSQANGSISGYEMFVDNNAASSWRDSWIEQDFRSSAVRVVGRKVANYTTGWRPFFRI